MEHDNLIKMKKLPGSDRGFINVEIHLVFFFILLAVIFILGGFWTRLIVAGIAAVFGLAWLYDHISNCRKSKESDAEKK